MLSSSPAVGNLLTKGVTEMAVEQVAFELVKYFVEGVGKVITSGPGKVFTTVLMGELGKRVCEDLFTVKFSCPYCHATRSMDKTTYNSSYKGKKTQVTCESCKKTYTII